jgi:betaine-homocysteine S-methyltransferase
MSEGILQRLSEGVVLGDGGYLLELERRGYVQAGPFLPEASINHPEALAGLHREFVDAGVDVLQTLTFYASEDKLATVGLDGRVDDMNREATRIARRVAGEAERDVLVAGNLSCAWVYQPNDPESHHRTRELFDRQLAVMTEEGIDFVIAETFNWTGEAMIAAEAIKDTGLPAMVTMGLDNNPNSFEGYSPGEQVRRLADAGVDIVGTNCFRSPEHMLPYMEEMRAAVPDTVYMAAQPVAFHGTHERPNFVSLPEFPYELEKITLPRAPMGKFALQARDLGYNYIGSCCGSVAAHVREMARSLGKMSSEEREWRTKTDKAQSGYELHRMKDE